MEKDETLRVIAEQLADKNVTPAAIAGYEMIQTAVMALQVSADKEATKNYIEITMGGLHAPFDRAAIHLIRPEGMSPHELRELAERELGGARVEIRQALSAVEDRDRALRQAREKLAAVEHDRDRLRHVVENLGCLHPHCPRCGDGRFGRASCNPYLDVQGALDTALIRVKELEEEMARWQPSIDVLKNTPPSRLDEMIAALEATPAVVEPVALPQELVDAVAKGDGDE